MKNLMHEIHNEGEHIICFVCGMGKYGFAIHHLVSRGRGGTNDIKNLVPCCLSCHDCYHNYPDQFKKLFGELKYKFMRGKL